MPKIERDEVARRLAFVEEQLATLTPLRELYPAFRKKFGTSQRTAERYVRRVHEAWAAEAPAKREHKRGEIERAADVLYRVALARKDARGMSAALDLKAKLHGLYRPEDNDDPAAPVHVHFDCEPAPGAVPAPPHVAASGDPPRD